MNTKEILMKRLLSVLKNPKKILFYIESKGFFNFLSDERYIKFFYKLNLGKKLDLKNPKTFNEKLQWLKLNDRKDVYTIMVDKYQAKNYVSEKIGEEYIVKTLGIWEKFNDIDFDKLPDKFVLKCTHNSGGVVVCSDKATLNLKQAKNKINKSLKRNYYHNGREWPYKNVKPRIIAEEFLSENIIDYKVFCFGGKAEVLHTCVDREINDLKIDFFDFDWNHLDIKRDNCKTSDALPKKPVNLDKMKEISEVLSQGIKFTRVDFYEIEGKLLFGEISFFPASGFRKFIPEEWDLKFGKLIEL